MIYNFRPYSISQFRVNVAIYKRSCTIYKKRNGLYRLKREASILIDDIAFSDMQIEGTPIRSISEIENIIYNRDCSCGDIPPPVDNRIFDRTFDKTFE